MARQAAARQDQLEGAGFADQGAEPMGATCAGNNREAGFGEADERVGAEDAEGGGESEFEAATEGFGGDGGDGGEGEEGEGGESSAEGGEECGGPGWREGYVSEVCPFCY